MRDLSGFSTDFTLQYSWYPLSIVHISYKVCGSPHTYVHAGTPRSVFVCVCVCWTLSLSTISSFISRQVVSALPTCLTICLSLFYHSSVSLFFLHLTISIVYFHLISITHMEGHGKSAKKIFSREFHMSLETADLLFSLSL